MSNMVKATTAALYGLGHACTLTGSLSLGAEPGQSHKATTVGTALSSTSCQSSRCKLELIRMRASLSPDHDLPGKYLPC